MYPFQIPLVVRVGLICGRHNQTTHRQTQEKRPLQRLRDAENLVEPYRPRTFAMNEFEEFEPEAANWAAKLLRQLRSQPTPRTVEDAIAPIRALTKEPDKDGDMWNQESFELFMGVFEETLDGLISRLGLHGYESEYAKAIHAYTLEDPPIYRLCAKQMFAEDRHLEDGSLSPGVKAALTFYGLLTEALLALPENFRQLQKVFRGLKYVFPSPSDHRVEDHFPAGRKLIWYEPKSSSRNYQVMHQRQFCGLEGPRTVFTVHNPITGFRIEDFSAYGKQEQEVPRGSLVLKSLQPLLNGIRD